MRLIGLRLVSKRIAGNSDTGLVSTGGKAADENRRATALRELA
jgi:hypothetical protein